MNINLTKLNEKFGNINNKTELSNLGITSCNVLESTDLTILNQMLDFILYYLL